MGRPSVNILSRQLIAEEALTMYQEVGFRGSSLRKLAERLGVKSPSLYHHIASQDDLIDAMREVIEQGISDHHLDNPHWRRGIGEHARAYRVAYAAHPVVASMIARRPPTSSTLTYYDTQTQAFQRYGFDIDDALRICGTIDYLVFGSMMAPLFHTPSPAPSTPVSPPVSPAVSSVSSGTGIRTDTTEQPGQWPALSQGMGFLQRASLNQEIFEWALERMLDGLEIAIAQHTAKTRLIAEQTSPPAPPP